MLEPDGFEPLSQQVFDGDARHVAAVLRARPGGFPVGGRSRFVDGRPVLHTLRDVLLAAAVGAAEVYGDDPARALTAKAGPPRRCLAPAATAVAELLKVPLAHAALEIGLTENAALFARREGGDRFEQAVKAAKAAVRRAAGAETLVLLERLAARSRR